jgi:DNA-binding transcriptional regulator YiaG
MQDRELIKRAQAKLDMTQAELAKEIGVGMRTLAGWCCGSAPMSGPARRLLALLESGKVTVSDWSMETSSASNGSIDNVAASVAR